MRPAHLTMKIVLSILFVALSGVMLAQESDGETSKVYRHKRNIGGNETLHWLVTEPTNGLFRETLDCQP